MKRKSPMEMKSSKGMEQYAQKRNAELSKPKKPVPMDVVRPMMMNDPDSDLHTLTRAAEIKADKGRHRAAKGAAKRKHRQMAEIMGKNP